MLKYKIIALLEYEAVVPTIALQRLVILISHEECDSN
jgi:hypothetical protein